MKSLVGAGCVLKVGEPIARVKRMIPARSSRAEKNVLGIELTRFIHLLLPKLTRTLRIRQWGVKQLSCVSADERKDDLQRSCRRTLRALKAQCAEGSMIWIARRFWRLMA